jgi:hypothetical protein
MGPNYSIIFPSNGAYLGYQSQLPWDRGEALLGLAQSGVLNGINPLEYFTDVLMRMNDLPADLTELLPGNWKPPS